MKKTILLFLALCSLSACTDNRMARRFGGSQTIDLAPGTKVVNVTWRDDDLWIVTRVRKKDEAAENYTFFEKSSWGMLEGTIILKEH